MVIHEDTWILSEGGRVFYQSLARLAIRICPIVS